METEPTAESETQDEAKDATSTPNGSPSGATTTSGDATGSGGSTRMLKADAIVHRNVLWAFSAGILPLPIFDLVAITGVQVKLLKELSDLYELEFTEGMAKKAVTSLLVGVGGIGIGSAIGTSLLKFVPIIGYALSAASIPVVSGALTHAVGKAFIMHFEAGGTILDFDPKAMRDFFESEFEKAKATVAKLDLKQSKREATDAPATSAPGPEIEVNPTP